MAEHQHTLTGERKILLQKGEMSVWVDHYDDIFSDFDPRPYGERSLSDDFLGEAKKMAHRKDDVMTLRILTPGKARKASHEELIRKRLHEHFAYHHERLRKETGRIQRNGALLATLGFILMMVATALYQAESSVLVIFLIVLTEPSGWFMVWFGLDQVFYTAKAQRPDLEFYEKMSKAQISFESY